MIGIIDSPVSNLTSVAGAFKELGIEIRILKSPQECAQVHKIILPGVGHARAGMEFLNQSGWAQTLKNFKNPMLGICLGAQLFTEFSDEGEIQCLGLVPVRTYALKKLIDPKLSIPHMGWNEIEISSNSSLKSIFKNSESAYFAHSYAIPVFESTQATFEYGAKLTCIYRHKNILGIQFHPERSSQFGLELLKIWSLE
jgi:glutamine amidotransferase